MGRSHSNVSCFDRLLDLKDTVCTLFPRVQNIKENYEMVCFKAMEHSTSKMVANMKRFGKKALLLR